MKDIGHRKPKELEYALYSNGMPGMKASVRALILGEVGSGYDLMTDYYHRVFSERRDRICKGIACVTIGLVNSYPEFRGIGIASFTIALGNEGDEATDGLGLSLVTDRRTNRADPERTASSLIELINGRLADLDSPHSLADPTAEEAKRSTLRLVENT
jgi:hypothetical protein